MQTKKFIEVYKVLVESYHYCYQLLLMASPFSPAMGFYAHYSQEKRDDYLVSKSPNAAMCRAPRPHPFFFLFFVSQSLPNAHNTKPPQPKIIMHIDRIDCAFDQGP